MLGSGDRVEGSGMANVMDRRILKVMIGSFENLLYLKGPKTLVYAYGALVILAY
jgi:hypothetical protein